MVKFVTVVARLVCPDYSVFRAASIPVSRIYEMTNEHNSYPRWRRMGNAAALTGNNGDIVHPPMMYNRSPCVSGFERESPLPKQVLILSRSRLISDPRCERRRSWGSRSRPSPLFHSHWLRFYIGSSDPLQSSDMQL